MICRKDGEKRRFERGSEKTELRRLLYTYPLEGTCCRDHFEIGDAIIGKNEKGSRRCTRAHNLNSNFVDVERRIASIGAPWGLVVAQISLATSGNKQRKSAELALTSADKLAMATPANLLAVPYPLPQYFRYAEWTPLHRCANLRNHQNVV
jgi:hypothetical protein